jgi:hypothetical protein
VSAGRSRLFGSVAVRGIENPLEFNRSPGDDLFPGSKSVTKLDTKGAAHPHTQKNDGTTTGVALSKIKESKGVVQVTVNV